MKAYRLRVNAWLGMLLGLLGVMVPVHGWAVASAVSAAGPSANALIGAPSLVNPANGAVNVAVLTHFNWDGVSGANAGYEYQVLRGGAVVANGTTGGGVTAVEVLLEEDTSYSWRVRGRTGSGPGPWSSLWRFTTRPPIQPPDLVNPPNGATRVSLRPTLRWNPVEGATSYEYVVTDGGAVVATGRIGGTAIEVELAEARTYVWQVRGATSVRVGLWSPAWSFTTRPPLDPPVLLRPGNGTVDTSLNVSLDWRPVEDATGYDYEVVRDGALVAAGSAIPPVALNLPSPGIYLWHARGKTSARTGPWSETWSFDTRGPIRPPRLVSPNNGANNVPLVITLDWDATENATGYEYQVLAGGIRVAGGMIGGTEVELTLEQDTTYAWQVRGRTSARDGEWSALWSFRTRPPMAAPVLMAPDNGAAEISLRPTLRWMSPEFSTFSEYELYDGVTLVDSGRVGGAANAVIEVTLNPTLLEQHTYRWRARGGTSVRFGNWSDFRTFTTVVPLPAPLLNRPDENAEGTGLQVALDWTPVSRATVHDYEVWQNGSVVRSEAAAPPVTVNLPSPGIYQWRARGRTSTRTGAWSAFRSFDTREPIRVPRLVSPADGAVDRALVQLLDWDAAAGADRYEYEVRTGGTLVTSGTTDSGVTQATVTLAENTTYAWRARGRNGVRLGNWSAEWTFRTREPIPAPRLLSPNNGAVAVALRPRLSWRAAPGATAHEYEVVDAAGNVIRGQAGRSDVVEVLLAAPLSAAQSYRWRARGVTSARAGDWSGYWTFQTVTPPAAPELLSPAEGAQRTGLTPTLNWRPVTGATGYDYRVLREGAEVLRASGQPPQRITLPRHGPYQWQVRARSGDLTSPWSVARNFHTRTGASCTVAADWSTEWEAGVEFPVFGEPVRMGDSRTFGITVLDEQLHGAGDQVGSLELILIDPAAFDVPYEFPEEFEFEPADTFLNLDQFCSALPGQSRVLAQRAGPFASWDPVALSTGFPDSGDQFLMVRATLQDGRKIYSSIMWLPVSQCLVSRTWTAALESDWFAGDEVPPGPLTFNVSVTDSDDEDAQDRLASVELFQLKPEDFGKTVEDLSDLEDKPAREVIDLDRFCGALPSGAILVARRTGPFTADTPISLTGSLSQMGDTLLLVRATTQKDYQVYSSLLWLKVSNCVVDDSRTLSWSDIAFGAVVQPNARQNLRLLLEDSDEPTPIVRAQVFDLSAAVFESEVYHELLEGDASQPAEDFLDLGEFCEGVPDGATPLADFAGSPNRKGLLRLPPLSFSAGQHILMVRLTDNQGRHIFSDLLYLEASRCPRATDLTVEWSNLQYGRAVAAGPNRTVMFTVTDETPESDDPIASATLLRFDPSFFNPRLPLQLSEDEDLPSANAAFNLAEECSENLGIGTVLARRLGPANSDGTVTFPAVNLPAGEHVLLLRAITSAGRLVYSPLLRVPAAALPLAEELDLTWLSHEYGEEVSTRDPQVFEFDLSRFDLEPFSGRVTNIAVIAVPPASLITLPPLALSDPSVPVPAADYLSLAAFNDTLPAGAVVIREANGSFPVTDSIGLRAVRLRAGAYVMLARAKMNDGRRVFSPLLRLTASATASSAAASRASSVAMEDPSPESSILDPSWESPEAAVLPLPQLMAPVPESSGGLLFRTVNGVAGQTIRLQRTLDFLHWVVVDVAVVADDEVLFRDPAPPTALAFYRVQVD